MSPANDARARTLLTAVIVILVAVVTALTLRTPSPLKESAPVGDFSAERADNHVAPIASVPHPTGSQANTRARDYLMTTLRGFGLSPQTDTKTVARSFARRTHVAGTVSNVRVTIPGSASTGKVLLAAHYDSVPMGPGASDGAATVGAMLEIARVLSKGPKLRNDVEILLSDGEEPGLLGARAYIESGQLGDPHKVFMLNAVARGTSGPAIMFQTSDDNSDLMAALRASGATATSVSNDVYKVLPNDTDLTVLADAGVHGMNFAFIGQSANYHTLHDDARHVSPSTLQDLGDSLLAATRHLGSAALGKAAEGSRTYFTVLGLLVSYPSQLTLPLALIGLAGFAGLLWLGRKRGLRPGAAGVAAASFLLPLLGAIVIGMGIWEVLLLVRPEYEQFGRFGLGDTYRPGAYWLAELCLVIAAMLAWYRWMRRRRSALEVAAGLTGWLALLGVVSAVLLPGGAYLFSWPALTGVVVIASALRWTSENSPWRSVAGGAAAIPATVLVLPGALLLVPTVGISMAAVPLAFAAVLAATMVPLLGVGRRRILTAVTAALVVAAPVLVGIGLGRDDYDASHPESVSLGYAFDADTGKATWLSQSNHQNPAIDDVLTGQPVAVDQAYPTLPGGRYLSGPAKIAPSAVPPGLKVLGETTSGGTREVRVRIETPADPHTLAVYADTSAHEVGGATVNGAKLDGGRNLPPSRGPWRWGLRYAGPSSAGVELVIQVRGTGPLKLRLIAQSNGLPEAAGPPRLPESVSWTAWPSIANQTLAAKTFQV